MNPFLQISSAFGLSSAAGLNAYIPMLIMAILANRHVIHLSAKYEFLSSWWCIAILVVLCIVELIVDKIPGADHVNDVVQTFIRPTAGAILFASQTGTISSVHPGVFLALGLLAAGAVHGAKAVSRPVINVASFGIGAPVASSIENFASTMLSFVAILFPFLSLLFMIFCGWMLIRMFKRFTKKRRALSIEDSSLIVIETVSGPPVAALPTPSPSTWRGGL